MALLGRIVEGLSSQFGNQLRNLFPYACILSFEGGVARNYVSSNGSLCLRHPERNLLQELKHNVRVGDPLTVHDQANNCPLGDNSHGAEEEKHDDESSKNRSFDS